MERILIARKYTDLEVYFICRAVFIFLFQFPYCDGTHNTHNKETGDNIGPLVIKCNKGEKGEKEEKKKSK